MKFLIFAFCIACASAAAIDKDAKVLRSDYNQSPNGDFQFSFETDNGIAAQAAGQLKQIGKDEAAVVVTGANSFQSPDGQKFDITYIADENGYQVQGAHLPTPPPPEPLPEHVVRTLAYIAAHPYVQKP